MESRKKRSGERDRVEKTGAEKRDGTSIMKRDQVSKEASQVSET